MESFDVITVSQGSDGKCSVTCCVSFIKHLSVDSKRSTPSLLARQLRLRLIAEDDSGVPRNLHNIVVSIHAIATFQALHDYLRPRVAGLLSGSSSRLSGMLAALAASGLASSSRASGSGSGPGEAAFSDPPAPSTGPEASASQGSSGSTITRRRSQRLSAKKNGSSSSAADAENAPAEAPPVDANAASSSSAVDQPKMPPPPAPESAVSETVVDSEMQADFTDDEEEEVDAEVFDDEVDPENSISDKTVTLSVAEDGTKVEAQTPDGTRVATPNPAASMSHTTSSSRPSGSSRPSYASALKTKPIDWHLEFAMDDHVLPLDLTIYGAIHQHEMRKQTGPVPPSLFWQGVYTIKFKKVPGPAPAADSKFCCLDKSG